MATYIIWGSLIIIIICIIYLFFKLKCTNIILTFNETAKEKDNNYKKLYNVQPNTENKLLLVINGKKDIVIDRNPYRKRQIYFKWEKYGKPQSRYLLITKEKTKKIIYNKTIMLEDKIYMDEIEIKSDGENK